MTSGRTGTKAPLAGVAYASAAYLLWGLFPLYFRTMQGIPAQEILAHRIAWSAAFLVVLVTARLRWPQVLRQLGSRKTLGWLALSAALISTNWLIYIWAVNSEHVLEASLGYFVNPLVTVALGVVFLRDPLSARQRVALAVAAAGVAALVLRVHRVPWIAMSLAITFGGYGLVRKRVAVEATAGLLGEVGVLAPLAIGYLAVLGAAGEGHFGAGAARSLLLASTGVATAVPLIWFANGVQRLRLSTIGVLQYLNPTVQFAIAVFVFGEPFTAAHRLAFGCIWVSLAIYTAEAVALARRREASGREGGRPEGASGRAGAGSRSP